MYIGYLTTDDVNLDYASDLAAKIDATVIGFFPFEDPRELFVDALVIDIDHLPKDIAVDVINRINQAPFPFPTFGHTYEMLLDPLPFENMSNWRVLPRLDFSMMLQLAQAVHEAANRVEQAEEPEPDDEFERFACGLQA